MESTENYIQYLIINHNGKDYEKECICIYLCKRVYASVYIIEPLCCTAEINTL